MSQDRTQIVKHAGTAVEREGFEGKELERRHETSTSAAIARARVDVEAQYTMARRFPRDDMQVRSRLLLDCKRTEFAQASFYSIPRKGAKAGRITGTQGMVEGLTIRFSEAAFRYMGNVQSLERVTYDDDFKRQITVVVTDLETNAHYAEDIVVEKTVERSTVDKDRVVLGKRTNSAGNAVYIVQTTDDELKMKQKNLAQRAKRNNVLALLSADTRAECEKLVWQTVKARVAQDPEGERKALADAFASLSVFPADLKVYLGHDLGACAPAELLELRALYSAIRDGEVTWAAAVNERTAAPKVDADGVVIVEQPKSAGKTVAEKVKARAERMKAKAEAKAEPKAETKPEPSAGQTTLPMTDAEKAEAIKREREGK